MEQLGVSVLASLVLGISSGVEPPSPTPLHQISQATRSPSASRTDTATDAAVNSALPQCSGQAIFNAIQCQGDGQELEEARLHELVNQYRAEQGLPPIPRSPSLDLLANRHVLDIALNIGQLTHSWSDCDYNPSDLRTLNCSSRAAQRLGTAYPGKVYENAHYNARGATAASALRGWQNSPSHNALLLNLNNWRNSRWRAMGIGIYRQYAVLWVGEERDPVKAEIASIDPNNRRIIPSEASQPSTQRGVRLPRLRIRIR
ncbi:MAG: CAP domain-containing protein [Elainella sp. C42_A2020_010]|nr:CAP domain-containing protein [Elainella sp. C42_A2020_010]